MLVPDLNWMPHSLFKGITYPKVEYEEDTNQGYGGYYAHGSGTLTIIAADTNASTIAHEFCHYLQEINGVKLKGSSFDWSRGYDHMINRYFNTQPTEMEALLFEYKVARSWINSWWLRKLVLNQ